MRAQPAHAHVAGAAPGPVQARRVVAPHPGGGGKRRLVEVAALDEPASAAALQLQEQVDASLYVAHRGAVWVVEAPNERSSAVADPEAEAALAVWRLAVRHDRERDSEGKEELETEYAWEAVARVSVAELERLIALPGGVKWDLNLATGGRHRGA